MTQPTHVEPARLRDCAAKFDKAAEHGDEIAQKASDAEVDPYLWGLLGYATVLLPLAYQHLSESVREHIDLMREGLRSSAEKLRVTADRYEETDQVGAERFKGMGDGLGTGRYGDV